MKVVVLNTVLSNTGDAAIFEAIVNSLVRSGIAVREEIFAFDSAAKHTQSLYPNWNIFQQPTRSVIQGRLARRTANFIRTQTVRLASRSRLVRNCLAQFSPNSVVGNFIALVRDSEVVISSGGTYLVDHYNFNHRVYELQLAKSLNKTVVLWTQSMGPFRTTKAIKAMKPLGASVDLTFLRDARSFHAWNRVMTQETHNEVVPDVVFAIDTPKDKSDNHLACTQKLAIFSVRSWDRSVNGGPFDFNIYRQGIRRIAAELIEDGWRCMALSTCQGVPGYQIDDSEIAEKFFAGMEVDVNRQFHSPTELQGIIRTADLVVATRMHMAILSLVNRVPVVAIAYETKSLELFEGLGRPDAVIPIEMVSPDWVEALSASGGIETLAMQLPIHELDRIRTEALRPARFVRETLLRT